MKRARLDYSPSLWSIPLGSRDYSKRPDGKWNIWAWDYLLSDDLLPRWVLIAVVRKRRIEL